MPEQLGENSERGYLYQCNDMIWVDGSGFRPKGLIPDIVDQMVKVYQDGPKQDNPKVKLAREWAVAHDWKNVHQQWIDVFAKAKSMSKGDVIYTPAVGEIL